MPSFTARICRTAVACAILTIFLASCGGGSDEALLPPQPPAMPAGITLTNFQTAAVAIGQTNLQSGEANQGLTPDADTLARPSSVAIAPDGRMFIVDFQNFRVLGFGAVPTTHGASANLVLGQLTAQVADQPASADEFTFRGPTDISFGAGKTAIVDGGANRVLLYEGIPAAGQAADVVVGQLGFDVDGSSCTLSGLDSPSAATFTPDGKLVVVDRDNHRVLIWSEVPASSGIAADIVLGQPNGTTCVANNDVQAVQPSARTLNVPTGVWSDGVRLVVVDSGNRRVLVWDTFPTAGHQAADRVLGQPNFQSVGVVNPPTASSLRAQGPKAVAFNGSQFAVADTGNHRVLVWNGFPASNGQAADIVLGQKTAQLKASNDDDGDGMPDSDPSGRTFSSPAGVTFSGTKLLVSDLFNHRVLVFESN